MAFAYIAASPGNQSDNLSMRNQTLLGITDAEAGTGMPAKGSFIGSESGLNGLRVVSTSIRPSSIPGIWMVYVSAAAYNPKV